MLPGLVEGDVASCEEIGKLRVVEHRYPEELVIREALVHNPPPQLLPN